MVAGEILSLFFIKFFFDWSNLPYHMAICGGENKNEKKSNWEVASELIANRLSGSPD